jgi:hypothetical protein
MGGGCDATLRFKTKIDRRRLSTSGLETGGHGFRTLGKDADGRAWVQVVRRRTCGSQARAPSKASGTEVEESKDMELEAGSHLNHLQSTFRCTGPQQIEMAAGLALHPPARRQLLARGRIVSVWDSQQLASARHILARLFLPGRKRWGSASERATSCRSCR